MEFNGTYEKGLVGPFEIWWEVTLMTAIAKCSRDWKMLDF
jgi:hypothetical protein